MRALLVIVAALLLHRSCAFAIDTAPAFEDPALQARYERLIARAALPAYVAARRSRIPMRRSPRTCAARCAR